MRQSSNSMQEIWGHPYATELEQYVGMDQYVGMVITATPCYSKAITDKENDKAYAFLV